MVSISNYNIVLTKLLEMWERGNVTKKKASLKAIALGNKFVFFLSDS